MGMGQTFRGGGKILNFRKRKVPEMSIQFMERIYIRGHASSYALFRRQMALKSTELFKPKVANIQSLLQRETSLAEPAPMLDAPFLVMFFRAVTATPPPEAFCDPVT